MPIRARLDPQNAALVSVLAYEGLRPAERRVWIPALERAGVPYFRSYDLRHTCATLLLDEGRTLNDVAEHLGHADPGFTARTYAHVMRDASRRRRITISEAIRTGRVAARRRPLIDASDAEPAIPASRASKKSLEIGRADARTRTGDPFITSEGVLSVAVALGRSTPHGDTNIRGQKRTERTANDNLVCAWCARPRGRESYALEAP